MEWREKHTGGAFSLACNHQEDVQKQNLGGAGGSDGSWTTYQPGTLVLLPTYQMLARSSVQNTEYLFSQDACESMVIR